jgi:hypothetical protein
MQGHPNSGIFYLFVFEVLQLKHTVRLLDKQSMHPPGHLEQVKVKHLL